MRPSMLGVKNHNGPASVKDECCGNCPPKLSFDEWWQQELNVNLVSEDEARWIWQEAQRNA